MKHTASNAPSFLAGRTTLIMCIVLGSLLSSCATGYYRDQYGNLQSVLPSVPYYQYPASNPAPVYYYPRPVAVQQVQTQRSVQSKSRTSLATANPLSANHRPVRSQSERVMPPIPSRGYYARWDTRRTSNSPDGLFWVVDPAGNVTALAPKKFWPFWAECIYKGVPIKVFDQYDPGSRF